jgi:ribosomal protein S18 acetylase RimI-like enzyme
MQIEIDSIRFSDIRKIAEKTWPVAYGHILSNEQLRYMLDRFYSLASMQEQAEINQHRFLLALHANEAIGFASFSAIPNVHHRFRLHKLYILPEHQGIGLGKRILDQIVELIKASHAVSLELNVNRYNNAKHFYEKMGFQIVREEDIDIGQGYFMNDYVMEKIIPSI